MVEDNKDVYRGHTFEEFVDGLRPIQGKLLITNDEGQVLLETDVSGLMVRESKCDIKEV